MQDISSDTVDKAAERILLVLKEKTNTTRTAVAETISSTSMAGTAWEREL
jgi:hypothetical protein